MTHGALFSGSGGFELAAELCGIETLWNSEIEPFPRRVTKARFPETKQLGDIKTIDGGKIDPVDIISGGSPCQDMSVAGRREGLDGSRSTLFHEQIRIVKEMREATNGRYPKYMVWENVPGAFSSNGGEDFRCVLEETLSIAEQDVSVPRPSGGKWGGAGEIVGDRYSIAWRVMDAQYWGVPQRRRRIYLVADFAGQSAGKILFERESLLWNPAQSRIERERATGSPADSVESAVPLDFNPTDSRIDINASGVCQTLTARMGTGGNNTPLILQGEPLAFGVCSKNSNSMKSNNPNSGFYEAVTSRTLDRNSGNPTCNQGGILVVEQKAFINQAFGEYKEGDVASTVKARDHKYPTDLIVSRSLTVRKITPLECARLQGFPDYWTDGLIDENPSESDVQYWRDAWLEWWKSIGAEKGIKKPKDEKAVRRWLSSEPSDSDKYKMWGNGIALPCAVYVFEGFRVEEEEK